VLVAVGVSVGTGVSVATAVGVSVGTGVGVSVSVGVSVGTAVGVSVAPPSASPSTLTLVSPSGGGTTQLADAVVPSGFVTVVVRLEPGGPLTVTLLPPVSENGALVAPPGVTVYVPLIVVPESPNATSVNAALPLALGPHGTVTANGHGVGAVVDVGVTVGVAVEAARVSLKPSTLLPAVPVRLTVRQFE
jgi:hypothetical protein